MQFTRTLTEDEVAVLQAVKKWNQKGHDLSFHRVHGTNYQNLMETFERERSIGYLSEKAHCVMREIMLFAQGKRKMQTLTKIIAEIFQDDELYDELYKVRWLIDKVKRMQNSGQITPEEDEKEIRSAIRRREQPSYYGYGFKPFIENMKARKINHIVRGLQGIVSIKAGGYRQYRDVFIPLDLYKKVIIPALEDPKHQVVIRVENAQKVEALQYMYEKTGNLRRRYSNRFRPEFTRPEITREMGLSKMSLQEFRQWMAPLEGIIGRIERRDQISVGYRYNYIVSYNQPSWFLPLHHQRMLEINAAFINNRKGGLE